MTAISKTTRFLIAASVVFITGLVLSFSFAPPVEASGCGEVTRGGIPRSDAPGTCTLTIELCFDDSNRVTSVKAVIINCGDDQTVKPDPSGGQAPPKDPPESGGGGGGGTDPGGDFPDPGFCDPDIECCPETGDPPPCDGGGGDGVTAPDRPHAPEVGGSGAEVDSGGDRPVVEPTPRATAVHFKSSSSSL